MLSACNRNFIKPSQAKKGNIKSVCVKVPAVPLRCHTCHYCKIIMGKDSYVSYAHPYESKKVIGDYALLGKLSLKYLGPPAALNNRYAK